MSTVSTLKFVVILFQRVSHVDGRRVVYCVAYHTHTVRTHDEHNPSHTVRTQDEHVTEQSDTPHPTNRTDCTQIR